jgi:hypothetical protein
LPPKNVFGVFDLHLLAEKAWRLYYKNPSNKNKRGVGAFWLGSADVHGCLG